MRAATAPGPAQRMDAHVDAASQIRDTCFHCGETLLGAPIRVRVEGGEHGFCCAGCAAAAQWIEDAQLDDYYRLRSAPAARVDADSADLASWDREDMLSGHVRELAHGRELTLLTDGMRCAACAWLIDRALTREPGVLEVSANAVTGRIRIAWDPGKTPLSRPLQRLAALGYRPYLATGDGAERERRRERNRWLLRLGVAGLGAMQAMMFAEALYLDTEGTMSPAMRDFLRWIAFLVSTPVVFYAGWPFIAGAARELRQRRAGMDTLVATSTLLAYVASLAETLRGGPQVWYDAAVMFVFLLLAARMLEQRARSVASAQVDALARARPVLATREDADGRRERIPVATLCVGDVACIAIGESVPADGTLLYAPAHFEEALLTGESHPVRKDAGEPVFAGTVCRETPARIRVDAVGAGTRLSQLVRLVEEAQAHRPALAVAADRIASRFVFVLLAIAALTYAAWRVHDASRAFEVALALLVISCPCALSLAVPAALAAANGALARLGVLPLRADALDRLARTSDVVFDKTGTLGDGKPKLGTVQTFGDVEVGDALRIAAALERDSRHPLAHAFNAAMDAAEAMHTAAHATTAVLAHPGLGIEGRVEARQWRLGRADFAAGCEDDGAVWLGDGEAAFARFEVLEGARADARATLDALDEAGITCHLSSGDSAEAVRRFAQRLGIDDARARQSPEDKLAFVRTLQRRGAHVAMVGDGLNDAPVLAGADVSLAIGDGAALAQRAADLVLASPSLQRIPAAIALARRTRRVVRQNFAWALGYNLLALPLAAAGLVTPWIAALGMALSSLTVTLNALRLLRVRPPREDDAATPVQELRA